jgi:hypothetical protein
MVGRVEAHAPADAIAVQRASEIEEEGARSLAEGES